MCSHQAVQAQPPFTCRLDYLSDDILDLIQSFVVDWRKEFSNVLSRGLMCESPWRFCGMVVFSARGYSLREPCNRCFFFGWRACGMDHFEYSMFSYSRAMNIYAENNAMYIEDPSTLSPKNVLVCGCWSPLWPAKWMSHLSPMVESMDISRSTPFLSWDGVMAHFRRIYKRNEIDQ